MIGAGATVVWGEASTFVGIELSMTTLLTALGLGLSSGIVAIQAHRRGYSMGLWLLVSLLGNPIFSLVLLAIMPDRRLLALRRHERAMLDVELASLTVATPGAPRPSDSHGSSNDIVPMRSIGDRPTVLPPGEKDTRG